MTEPEHPLSLPRIADLDQPWMEEFLDAHPEMRPRIEELRRRDREERDFAEAIVRDIYTHYATGVPSRRGLTVALRAFVAELEDEDDTIARLDIADEATLAQFLRCALEGLAELDVGRVGDTGCNLDESDR
jgi:hypothetical protein